VRLCTCKGITPQGGLTARHLMGSQTASDLRFCMIHLT
jgi:hypothetical protein